MIYNSCGPNTILKCIYIPLGIMSLKAACIFSARREVKAGKNREAIQKGSKKEKRQKGCTVNTLRRFLPTD